MYVLCWWACIAHRPPVGDIVDFLESTKGWIMTTLFAGKDISKVAHGLAGLKTLVYEIF